jgi:penicillin-binding protein 1A
MLYWFRMFLAAAIAGLAGSGLVPYIEPYLRAQRAAARFILTWFKYIWSWHIRVVVLTTARRIRRIRLDRLSWASGVVYSLICVLALTGVLVALGFRHVYFDRSDLPDMRAFAAFEFSTIGHVYDVNGRSFVELAREYRKITEYKDIPPVVRDAILAAEDKNFFSHSGVDYSGIPRVLGNVRFGTLLAGLMGLGRHDHVDSPAIFPQGGSTITQQLVRGHFLQNLTAEENSHQLRYGGLLPRVLSQVIGARSVNMWFRKMEEIRLSLWLETDMQQRFGSKRRAKEEIFARYASFIYMGHGQYGFARAAEFYFGRPLATFTVDDADKAALLAGIAKSPRTYAPSAAGTERILRRRNQTLALMAANGFISRDRVRGAVQRPIQVVRRNKDNNLQAAAVVENILQEIKDRRVDLSVEDLLQGRIQVHSTVDARVQRIMSEALEHGLEFYEKRHPSAKGVIQGSVVVLRNGDASIIAETGGRQFYQNRSATYSDFNRVTKSLRQPGSAMKPMVYLAAFRRGTFNLESLVPDEPIGVTDRGEQGTKWISNYDDQFKGMIPLREALAESRNAVAIWITEQIGIASVLETSRSLGVRTPLQPYATTALGASEVNLLELANAYRTMASGILAQPYVIRKILRDSGEVVADSENRESPVDVADTALSLIQEGLRGVVRIPTGTAHTLDASGFPIAVMGKTGTTNEFRDALFVGSTYGPIGITVAVRIGFDDNHSLGPNETGGRVALPVFKEIMLKVYGEKLVGPVPQFPPRMEQAINDYLTGGSLAKADLPGSSRP